MLTVAKTKAHNCDRHKDIDPCEDFRAYACEGFDAVNEIREDQTSVGSLQIMSEDGQLILKRILESPPPKDTSLFWTAASPDQEIFAKLQDGYGACMNETLLRSIASRPLLEQIYVLVELYPVRTPRDPDRSLTDAVGFLLQLGVRAPISLGVGADDKDPDANVISLSPPYSFGLPSKQYYKRSDLVESYKDTIGSVLEALIKESDGHGPEHGHRPEHGHHPKHGHDPLHAGASQSDADAFSAFRVEDSPDLLNRKTIDALVEFEANMAEVAPDPEDLSDITKVYNPRSLKEADSYNPAISVKTIIDRFTDGYEPPKIIVASPDYLKSLAKILESQRRDVVQAYLVWKLVQSYGTVVESDAVEPLRRFNNELQGKAPDVKPERWRTCIGVVDSDLRKSGLCSLYVSTLADTETHQPGS